MDYMQIYQEIVNDLLLSPEADRNAAASLDSLLPDHLPEDDILRLEKILRNKKAIVYGAGPSLRRDIEAIRKNGLHRAPDYVHIAADGAVKALLQNGIVPKIQVTDLDGFPDSIVEANKKGAVTVVHAHGDNVPQIKDLVPKLKDVIGTTQTEPFGKLHNFGGFTDGDRCVFLADRFSPELIILAGMDFGNVIGDYSGKYDKEKKIKKLAIGKKLIEEYARESNSVILNFTSGGEEIKNVPPVSAADLKIFS